MNKGVFKILLDRILNENSDIPIEGSFERISDKFTVRIINGMSNGIIDRNF